jgi:hypothetical protein
VVGAQVLDRVVLLAQTDQSLRRASFTISGEGARKILVCGLEPGRWSVEQDGRRVLADIPVEAADKSLYLVGGAGSYVVKRER